MLLRVAVSFEFFLALIDGHANLTLVNVDCTVFGAHFLLIRLRSGLWSVLCRLLLDTSFLFLFRPRSPFGLGSVVVLRLRLLFLLTILTVFLLHLNGRCLPAFISGSLRRRLLFDRSIFVLLFLLLRIFLTSIFPSFMLSMACHLLVPCKRLGTFGELFLTSVTSSWGYFNESILLSILRFLRLLCSGLLLSSGVLWIDRLDHGLILWAPLVLRVTLLLRTTLLLLRCLVECLLLVGVLDLLLVSPAAFDGEHLLDRHHHLLQAN